RYGPHRAAQECHATSRRVQRSLRAGQPPRKGASDLCGGTIGSFCTVTRYVTDVKSAWGFLEFRSAEGLTGNSFGGLDIGLTRGDVKEHETHMFYMSAVRKNLNDGAHCDLSRFVHRIAEGSG